MVDSMAYKKEHSKENFHPKSGKILDQVQEVIRYHHCKVMDDRADLKPFFTF